MKRDTPLWALGFFLSAAPHGENSFQQQSKSSSEWQKNVQWSSQEGKMESHEKLKCLERKSIDTSATGQEKPIYSLPRCKVIPRMKQPALYMYFAYKLFNKDTQPNSRWVFSHHSIMERYACMVHLAVDTFYHLFVELFSCLNIFNHLSELPLHHFLLCRIELHRATQQLHTNYLLWNADKYNISENLLKSLK